MEKKIVALDVSNLWTPYMNNTMALCVNKYALQTIQDPEINAAFCNALNIAENIVQKIAAIFNQEHFPIPKGFTEEDVHLNAPRLFSDELWLFYLHQMSIHGLTAYSLGITASRRRDVRQFYFETYNESYELYETTLGVLQSKGFMERSPTIALPEKIEFAEKQNFLAGWFGHQRPLNTIEISSLYFNLQKTILTKDLALGFSQTAKLKEIRRFMEEVVQVAAEHIEIFTTILHEDFISSAITWDTHVTDSQIAPFSDKLMMFHCAFLIQAAMAYYGTALSGSMRRDLGLKYSSAIARDVKLAEDYANILIANGWFEEPPSSVDRRELS
ncbi:DUF3231 family protein [Niallia oryzisoli]|uniref:DUF3231 family protein n=1 Tax=Niallia oryzisoli TaxID=1737571 RepID=A0ABZ2CE13_9BACI